MIIPQQTIERYLWPASRVNWVTPGPKEVPIVPDYDREVRKKFFNPELRPSENSQKIQSIIEHWWLKEPITAYRLCLFFNTRKGDVFEQKEIVPTTTSVTFLKQMLSAWKEYFPQIPKPIVAKIFVPKGMYGLSPSLITKNHKREGEFILGIDRVFYVKDDPYNWKIGKEEYQFVNLGVSFAVEEETYQKYKNSKRMTYEQLIKNDEKVRQRKYN
jgi:hypothetical protein